MVCPAYYLIRIVFSGEGDVHDLLGETLYLIPMEDSITIEGNVSTFKVRQTTDEEGQWIDAYYLTMALENALEDSTRDFSYSFFLYD